MLLPFCQWIAGTHLGIAIGNSTYAFPIIEMFHLLALAIFGGAILLVDLRFLGLGYKNQSASTLARELFPLVAFGLLAMIVSGLLMFAGGPLRYIHNPMFQWKMALFVFALLFHFAIQGIASRRDLAPTAHPLWLRCSAVLSLLLWLSIGLAGRAIGYV